MALMAMAVDHCDLSGSIQSSPGAFSAISEFQQQVEQDAQQQQQQQQRQRMSSFRSRIVRTSSAKVRGSANTRPGQSSSTVLDRQNIWKQREHKTAAILLIVTSAFIVCWLPYFVMELVTPLCRCDEYLPPPPIVISSVTWLGYCNSLLNPIIYTVTSADFRIAFKNLLRLAWIPFSFFSLSLSLSLLLSFFFDFLLNHLNHIKDQVPKPKKKSKLFTDDWS